MGVFLVCFSLVCIFVVFRSVFILCNFRMSWKKNFWMQDMWLIFDDTTSCLAGQNRTLLFESECSVWCYCSEFVTRLGRDAGCVFSSKLLEQVQFCSISFKSLTIISSGFFFAGRGRIKGMYFSDALNLHWHFILFCFFFFWSCLQWILLPLLDHMPGNVPYNPSQLLSFLWYAFFCCCCYFVWMFAVLQYVYANVFTVL